MNATPVALLALAERDSRKAFGSLLTEAGFEVRAVSAAGLLAAPVLDRIGFILLDSELPDQDGLEVCRVLKNRDCAPPVMLRVPAGVEDSRRRAASSTDADAHLWEPSGPEVVLAAGWAMLRLARERRESWNSGQRMRELEAKAHAAQADLEQIASQVCHDFEEPFRAITTFAELLEERGGTPVSQEDRNYLNHAIAAGRHFRLLLRGVLSYSLAGRLRREEFHEVDLGIAASGAIQMLGPMVESTGATIEFDQPLPRVHGDFGTLQQLFELLIGNAILHGGRNAAPCIRIGASRTPSGEWPVWISDDGPGIPGDRREFVFQPFKRLRGRETPGAGLGLAIARRIVEAHRGKIWIEAGSLNGARVCFQLPTPRRTA